MADPLSISAGVVGIVAPALHSSRLLLDDPSEGNHQCRGTIVTAFLRAQLKHAIQHYQNMGVAVEQTFTRRQVKPSANFVDLYTTTSSATPNSPSTVTDSGNDASKGELTVNFVAN
ncbi:hypothetical protein V500_03098 [Pseudogymnoascus sp. VKM F-4518 (FW-2643)]|nr:hypothetical protein V500_03098 [Pseudogymnoascus sp. VKM F-4518 (FW-2643)]